jgi:hypothetical protein
VFWRPWAPRPVLVAHGFFYTKPDWHRRHVHVVHKPVHVHQPHIVPGKWRPQKHVVARPYVRVPESQRKPIVQQHHMPAASGFSNQKRQFASPQHQPQPRPQAQGQPRPQVQGQLRPQVQGQPRPQVQAQPRHEARGHPVVRHESGLQPPRSHPGNGGGFRTQGGGFRGQAGNGGGGFRGRG